MPVWEDSEVLEAAPLSEVEEPELLEGGEEEEVEDGEVFGLWGLWVAVEVKGAAVVDGSSCVLQFPSQASPTHLQHSQQA